jgi:hypothetical protein
MKGPVKGEIADAEVGEIVDLAYLITLTQLSYCSTWSSCLLRPRVETA